MRALVVKPGPHFSVEDVANGYIAGLSSVGVDVRTFNLGDVMELAERGLRSTGVKDTESGQPAARIASQLLRGAALDWWPDLVLIVSSFFVPPECYAILRARGMKVVTLFTESPYEDDNQLAIAAHADACIVNDPMNIERFRQVAPTEYLPHAYDPDVHFRRPASAQYASDFCFVGTGYPSRIEFFEACDFAGVDVALAGNWQNLAAGSPLRKFVAHDLACCIDNGEAADLYSNTKASVNVYRTEAQRPGLSGGWAMGPREVEMAALGTFFLTEARGENREVLPMVPTFDGPDDFSDKLRWWLGHDAERVRVADAARAAVADRTFTSNARRLLELAGV